MGRKRLLSAAQDARGHHYQGFEKRQHSAHRYPEDPERDENEPDERVEQQGDHRQRPAKREQNEPEQEFDQRMPPWGEFYSLSYECQQSATNEHNGTGVTAMENGMIILASRSARRLDLLSGIVQPERIIVIGSDVDESIFPGEKAGDYCRRVAREKATAVWRARARGRDDIAVVIGADTVVVLGAEILGQPRDKEQALGILKKLNGRQHAVMTGVALVHGRSGRIEELLVESMVWMRDNDPEMLQAYVATGEPMDKAGAYALQGRGRDLIERYEGSYSNIVGLPVDELKHALSGVLR